MSDRSEMNPPADEGRLDRRVRPADPECVVFDRWLRDNGHCEDQHDDMLMPLQRSLNELMWGAWKAATEAERSRCAHVCGGLAAGYTAEARRLDGLHATHAAGKRDGANECAAVIRRA